MKIQCVLCDRIEDIEPDSSLGKKLRNRPLYTYVCPVCHQRIKEKTEKRKREGRLQEPFFRNTNDDW